MTTTKTILLYALAGVTNWVLLYYVIKAAVRNGIKEARAKNTAPLKNYKKMDEGPPNDAQANLQKQYESGKITFEEFQSQWNKLNA